MKQPPGPTQGLSLADFRQQQLVAACGPVWLFNKGIHLASILRSVLTLVLHGQSLQETVAEAATAAAFAVSFYAPTAALQLKRPDMIQAACAIMYSANSMLISLTGWGVTLFPASARGCLSARAEVAIDMVLTYQCQLSLPVMAILHAFRQVAWMCVILWRMDGDPRQLIIRGAINWAVLMLVSGLFEVRIRAAHQTACRAMQQQQEQHTQPEEQPGMSCAHPKQLDSIYDSANETWSDAKPQSQSCIDAASKSGADSMRKGPSIKHELEEPMEGQATDSGTVTAFPGEAAAQPPVPAMPAAAREAQGTSVLSGAQQAKPAPNQQQQPQATLTTIKSKYASSYKRGRRGQSNTVHVKVEGIELEHLPADLPELLQKQLSYCMPGVTMTGLALRSGCVMLTLDLMRYAEEGTVALSADGMRDLITRLMQSQAMGQVLEDGAPMCIQMPDELALCRWDSASGSYTSEGAPALDSADWYSCRMVSAGPVVHCVSNAAKPTSAMSGDVPACHQLTLTVVLELPSNCQLHGWQPSGTAAPAGSVGLLQESSQDGPVVDAMLLARRLGGGYLPVVVEQVPRVGKSSSDTTALQTSVQVVVSVAGEGPAALNLELWCKQADAAVGGTNNQFSWVPGHMPGLELLVAHMPLLVMPSSWKEAAAELQQHIDDIGGVQPQHALPEYASGHMASTTVHSCLSMKQQSYQDLCSDFSTLHGMPPAAGQPVIKPDQTDSGQLMQHKRSPQASDSVSSHFPARIQPPANDSDSDPACCFLEDLGMLLTHKPTAGTTGPAVSDNVMKQLGDDLLVYAVQHGLASVASMIVGTVQRIEQRSAASTAITPAIVSPSAWLLRVAGCASNSDSDGLPGGNGGRMSLLHAAMASGSADMLGHVFRWGTLYGGPDWAWPWELEDATGCTALHLASAQPAAGVCAALLKTITCMLPAAQVQAARNAWLHCKGGLGATPAQLFALASNGGYVGETWSNEAQKHDNNDASTTQLALTTTSVRPRPSPASSSGLPQLTASAVQPPTTHAQSWLGSMVEVWTSREPEEYHTWAKRQDSISLWYWAIALIVLSANGMFRSAMAGYLQYEWLYLSLYSWFMIPAVIATAGGNEWLGSSKVWLVLAQVLPICSHLANSRLLSHQAPMWAVARATGVDVLYVLLMGLAIDKVPMPQLVVSRAIEALAQGYAARTAGFPYPLSRSLAIHITVLVISMVARIRKLKAFYRWQARQQELKQLYDRERENVGKKRA